PSWPGRRARSLTASRARGHGLGPQISRRRSLWLARACARGARSLLPLSQSSGTPRQPVGGEVVWVNGTDSAIRSRDNGRGLFQCFDGSLALGGRLDLCQPSVELGSRLIVVPDMEPCDVCVAHHVGGWRVLAHGCLLIVIHRSPYPSKLNLCACQRVAGLESCAARLANRMPRCGPCCQRPVRGRTPCSLLGPILRCAVRGLSELPRHSLIRRRGVAGHHAPVRQV